MILEELVLQTGVDIPFESAQLVIHQPTIEEIAYISEDKFWRYSSFLNFSKEKYLFSDKTDLNELTDFEILMVIINGNMSLEDRQDLLIFLELLFPTKKIQFTPIGILLVEDKDIKVINKDNFDDFKNIITDMFVSNQFGNSSGDYNPVGELSREIARKLREGKAKRNALKGNNNSKTSILSRYISILSVGLQKNKNDFLKYTVPQLFDEFNRFQLKTANDFYIQAKMAGAKDMQEVDPWMKDMYE